MKVQNSTGLIKTVASIVGAVGVTSLIALAGYSQSDSGSDPSNPTQSTPRQTNSPGSSSPSSETTNSPTQNRALDRTFVINAAQDSMAEVQLGQLATQRGSSDAVREFGQHMIQEHTQMNQELTQLATRKGVSLPTDIGDRNKAVMARLSRLSGSDFDQAYMSEMVDAHARDVLLFRTQAEQGQDRELKNWAARRLPRLEEHLQMARGMVANQ